MANQYRSVLASGGASTGGDALPAEVLAGKTFTNDNGAQTGTMTNNGAVTQTLSAGQSYTIPEGYHNGNGIVTASPKTTYKSVAFNPTSGSADFIIGFEFTPEELSGFTTITLSSNISGITIKYEVDNNVYGSLTNGSTPLTIPTFTTKLIVVASGSYSSHALAELNATLS